MDTELGRLARPYVEEGELVPDDVMLRVVEHALDAPEVRERGYLLDGFPRTAEQAAAFLDGHPDRLDAAIDLDLPVDEARRRLLARGRADDDPAVIDHRLALDAAEAAPLLELLDRAGLLRPRSTAAGPRTRCSPASWRHSAAGSDGGAGLIAETETLLGCV